MGLKGEIDKNAKTFLDLITEYKRSWNNVKAVKEKQKWVCKDFVLGRLAEAKQQIQEMKENTEQDSDRISKLDIKTRHELEAQERSLYFNNGYVLACKAILAFLDGDTK